MASIYKKFTAQDFATVPFNAHKQYNYDSGSAVNNAVSWYNTRYTSESISLYSSASTNPDGVFDPINTIKYNQINHLYYNKFNSNPAVLFDTFQNYLKHNRTLYEKTNILSIPSGLFGYEIKPGSLYISSSQYEVVDDTYGNLIIQGTNVDEYPTDKRQNVFKLEPTKGFRLYDPKIFDGYAVFRYDREEKLDENFPIGIEGLAILHDNWSNLDNDQVEEIQQQALTKYIPSSFYTRKFYRKGMINPNATTHYSTPFEIFDIDDSYYFNNIKYFNNQFQTSSLGSLHHKFPTIKFDNTTGSYITSPHNETFNFDVDDDFSISFYMEPQSKSGSLKIGDGYAGGTVFHLDPDYAYIATPAQAFNFSSPIPWASMTWLGANNNTMGGGEANTALMKVNPQSFVNPSFYGLPNINGYSDWWLANELETKTIIQNIIPLDNTFTSNADLLGSTYQSFVTSLESNSNDFFFTRFLHNNTGVDVDGNAGGFTWTDPYNPGNTAGSFISISFAKALNGVTDDLKHYFMVRKVKYSDASNDNKHYILSKSTTKTVVPEAISGKSATYNTKARDNMQALDKMAEPQFPFEIYLQSQSLCFDRSDGINTVSVTGSVTGSNGYIEKTSHILCQKTGSTMEIFFDGKKIATGDDSDLKVTRNLANLYIGSKGRPVNKGPMGSIPYSKNAKPSKSRLFNGTLTNLNIWNRAFNTREVSNISESINASPYIGNVFYRNGFSTITHPKYHKILSSSAGEGSLNRLQFKGTHLIYEHEYQCTINENEFNYTYNLSNRKIKSSTSYELAHFTTSSYFKPFVTTIGLYNENNELLVVGKLGQPIRMSDETDTTFIVRWDT